MSARRAREEERRDLEPVGRPACQRTLELLGAVPVEAASSGQGMITISKPGYYYYDTIMTFGINYVHYDTIMTLLLHLSLLQKSDYYYTL